MRGCIPGVKASTPYIIDGEEIWYCPLTYTNVFTNQCITLWKASRQGFLPDNGSYLEQSYIATQVLEMLESDQNEYDNKEMERKQKKIKRNR